MGFALLKWYARFCIKIFCRKIIVNKPPWLLAKGPLLFAANHPNSFLDGIILTILCEEQVHTLARGDAFKNKNSNAILRWLHLLPVYRTSEGVENLEHNYSTFDACKKILEQNGIILIFSEGRCTNEWQLRPLKKGTARLAIDAWLNDIELTVLPVGFNYNAFRNFGKNVIINFGEPLLKKEVLKEDTDGKRNAEFNKQLWQRLSGLVYEIAPTDKQTRKEKMFFAQPFSKKLLLFLPAIIGIVLHAPLYLTVKFFTGVYFNNDHYDSVIVSLLMLAYPFYLLLFFCTLIYFTTSPLALLVICLLPITAWACVQLKNQLD